MMTRRRLIKYTTCCFNTTMKKIKKIHIPVNNMTKLLMQDQAIRSVLTGVCWENYGQKKREPPDFFNYYKYLYVSNPAYVHPPTSCSCKVIKGLYIANPKYIHSPTPCSNEGKKGREASNHP